MKRTKFQRQISASSALSFAYKNLAKKNRPECEGFPLQCIFFCLFEFIPSIFPFSLTELTLSVLLSSVFFLHWTMQTVDDARSDCFQLLMVVMILLLCACCHVDDVHSTYSDFIIMIIVLNSNLLNNICNVCRLLFCHTESCVCIAQKWVGCNIVWQYLLFETTSPVIPSSKRRWRTLT